MHRCGTFAVGRATTISSVHRHHHLWSQPSCSHSKLSGVVNVCKFTFRPRSYSQGLKGQHLAACFSSTSPPVERPLQDDHSSQLASGGAALREAAAAPPKPETCTADELHYVSVPGSLWRLALWRYFPHPQASSRNHPLLLLSGVGTNAIGFDLDPNVSFARHLAEEGFDTWILEVRGAGLSKIEGQPTSSEIGKAANGAVYSNVQSMIKEVAKSPGGDVVENGEQLSVRGDSKVATSLSNVFTQIIERSKSFVDEGQSLLMSASLLDKISNLLENFQLSDRYEEFRERLKNFLEDRQNSTVTKQLVNMSNKLLKLLEDGQQAVSPQLSDLQDRLLNASQIADLQERLISTIDDFQKLLDLVVTYDWDFDKYLEEDIPAVMDYIRQQSKPKDGKMHAIGHSMGGILLYALIASQKETCSLASAVTLASSVDYTVSDSSLKMLLPLADPAQLLNVPAVPLGALMTALHPLTVNPPYAFAWLSAQVSAQEMMDPQLFKKLVLNNFCTIPAKLLLQLSTAFQPRGLRNRTGTFFFKDHLSAATVPVLAVAGDLDLICPPSAVLDTSKALPEKLVEYKLFGGEKNIHYGHYDLVCGREARKEILPFVTNFLLRHDSVSSVPESIGDEKSERDAAIKDS
ncbi:hypothetical protein GOP47_0030111 [Adiantum capillus-veneris]|nr:hypothetical protein GOP47_0030111 [Adiantum capillus-veneris]